MSGLHPSSAKVMIEQIYNMSLLEIIIIIMLFFSILTHLLEYKYVITSEVIWLIKLICMQTYIQTDLNKMVWEISGCICFRLGCFQKGIFDLFSFPLWFCANEVKMRNCVYEALLQKEYGRQNRSEGRMNNVKKWSFTRFLQLWE